MANHRVEINVSLAWWAIVYLRMLIFCCRIFGRYPDMDKLHRVLSRAVRVER